MSAEYKRLPGKQGSFLSSFRLWLGQDHLLNIETTGYAENYRRYYFRDIQAFVIQKTDRGKIWNFAWGGMAVVLALLGLWAQLSNQPDLSLAALVFAALCLLCLVINVMLGPTCACHVQTAVQRDNLRSLNRLRTARKVLARIRPHIEAMQRATPGAA